MKRFFTIFVVAVLVAACAKFNEPVNIQDSEGALTKIGMLHFDSKQSLHALINSNPETINQFITRSEVEFAIDSIRFISLTAPIATRVVPSDPILRIDGLRTDISWEFSSELCPKVSMYKVLGYDTLIPNRQFAKLLNARGEIAVGDTIYKISPKGTYYYEQSLKSTFEENYELYESSTGTLVAENLEQVDEGIFRYATFVDSQNRVIENPDIPEELPSEATDNYVSPSIWNDTDYTPNINTNLDISLSYPIATGETRNINIPWQTFPVFATEAQTAFGSFWEDIIGRNKSFTTLLSKKRRLKGKFYYFNYLVYAEIGVSAKFQKKNWIGWSGTRADKLFVGWSNIMFENGYEEIPIYPQNPQPKVASLEIKNLPGFQWPANVLTIVGLDVTDALQAQLSTKTPDQLHNWLKQSIQEYGLKYKIANIDVIQFYSADKVVTLLTNGYIYANNMESLDYTFLKDWGFTINIDLANLPHNLKSWANILNTRDLSIKPKNLKYGAMFIAAQLDNQWGGMVITKD